MKKLCKGDIIAYVGTLGNEIFSLSEKQIRDLITADAALMDGEIANITIDNLEEILEEAISEQQDMRWYAVMKDREDMDWGYGSFDLDKAKKMASDYPEGYIAVIQGGPDPVCIERIERGDF